MSAREEFNQLYNSDRMLEFVCKILVLLDRTDDFPIQFSTDEQQQAYYKLLAEKDFQGHFGQWDALRDELDLQIRAVRDEKSLLHTTIAELLFPFEAISSILYPADNESDYTKESAEELAKYRDLEVGEPIDAGHEPDCGYNPTIPCSDRFKKNQHLSRFSKNESCRNRIFLGSCGDF